MFINDFLSFARSDKSSGIYGEATEMAVRSYTGGRLVKSIKPNGKKDVYISFKIDGDKRRTVNAEIKTACGNIGDCAAAQFVIYWPEPMEDIDVEFSAVVFSREEWREFVNGYTGRGSFVRHAPDGDHIQSFRGIMSGARPKASLPIANYIYDTCDNQPTLADWLAELRA